jgi:hypothetical protein
MFTGEFMIKKLVLLAIVLLGVALFSYTQKKSTFLGKKTSDAPTLAGTWSGVYKSNQALDTKVVLMLQQSGTTVTGTYLTAAGTQGVIYGSVDASGAGKLSADQKTPTCPGHFDMDIKLQGSQLAFEFKGQHCAGLENGSGRASRATGKL